MALHRKGMFIVDRWRICFVQHVIDVFVTINDEHFVMHVIQSNQHKKDNEIFKKKVDIAHSRAKKATTTTTHDHVLNSTARINTYILLL